MAMFQSITKIKQFGQSTQALQLLHGIDPKTGKPFESASSAGGFTVVGKSDSGKTIVRDNITGVTGLAPSEPGAIGHLTVSSGAKALGRKRTPLQLARKGEARRLKDTRRGSKSAKAGAAKTAGAGILGTPSILGQTPILG